MTIMSLRDHRLILFICKHDPFENAGGQKFGLSRYTFRNVCDENSSVNLDDKTLKVVYNASAYEKERDEKIRAEFNAARKAAGRSAI